MADKRAEESNEITDDFFDDFDNDDFLNEIVEIAASGQRSIRSNDSIETTIPHLDDVNDDGRLQNEIKKLTKSIQYRKRKLADVIFADDRSREHRSRGNQPKSPHRATRKVRTNGRTNHKNNENHDDDIAGTSKRLRQERLKETQNTLSTYSAVIRKTSLADVHDSPHFIEKSISTSVRHRFNDPHIQEIANQIFEGFKVMVIMRGPPGCGKSYLAREIIDATTCDDYWNHIFSSSDFFYDRHGRFNFNSLRIRESHQWNKTRVERFAQIGWSPIIIDNTNIKTWEMENYLKIAVQCGYLAEIVEPSTPWSRSANELAIKNIHDVPIETIKRMISNYEVTSVKNAMGNIGLKYTMKMPQYRLQPPLIKSLIFKV